MKRISSLLKNISLILSMFYLASCQGLLTEDPKGQLAIDNFFGPVVIWIWL